MDSYKATFALSFKDYSEANEVETPPDEMIDKWRSQVVSNYQKSAPVDMVMSLFSIDKKKKKAIEYHEYTVKDTGYEINEEKKVLYVFLKLKITR